ncbi:cold-shock protein [Streptomyces sp. NPDC057694]|uniref:cold-shock protein n=1 Tax=Streptomyces sp. NPDC057694 TaxID=3346216 RepID=UPI00367A1E0B
MIAGKVIRYDAVRGYGFIAPEQGGEDVFLHVNDLLFPESSVRSGARVEFDVEQGDRGLKAAGVRLASQAPAAVRPAAVVDDDDESTCDVLSSAEYSSEVTELLLKQASWLTGEQIVQLRGELAELGRRHGWVED